MGCAKASRPFVSDSVICLRRSFFWSLRLKRGRVYVYNVAFVFLALALAEFWLIEDKYREGPDSDSYNQRDKELGYSLKPGWRKVGAARKFNDGRIIYSVSYTIDEFGLRATPNTESTRDSVFFFGCSFTFGECVNDSDSLPYLYSVLSGQRTRNFGLHGYGPHQMLRALETDRPKLLGIPESPSLVVYLALMDHMDRAAGRARWDRFGPQYELRNGRAEKVGSFADGRIEWVSHMLDYSLIFRKLADPRIGGLSLSSHQSDLERFNAIIQRSRDLVAEKYGAPFLVLVWDKYHEREDVDWLVQRLSQAGVDVIMLSKVIPGLWDKENYIPNDWHPTGSALKEVAQVIYDWSNAEERGADQAKSP